MDARQIAEKVRSACVEAAVRAYDDAGVQGLCAEGRWEAAVGAMRAVELTDVLQQHGTGNASPVTDVEPAPHGDR